MTPRNSPQNCTSPFPFQYQGSGFMPFSNGPFPGFSVPGFRISSNQHQATSSRSLPTDFAQVFPKNSRELTDVMDLPDSLWRSDMKRLVQKCWPGELSTAPTRPLEPSTTPTQPLTMTTTTRTDTEPSYPFKSCPPDDARAPQLEGVRPA